MWKHGVVRIRKFIHTAVDLISPMLLFILLYAFKDDINPVQKVANIDAHSESSTAIIPLTGIDPGNTFQAILYHPKSNITDALMKDVGRKLGLPKVDEFPEDPSSYGYGYYSYSNDAQLAAFIKKMIGSGTAVVMFENLTGDSLPNNLNYSIRMKKNFNTERYEAIDYAPGAHLMFGQDYLSFMTLQWAIDSSYIEAQSKKPIKQSLYVQEFPYYKTAKNEFFASFSGVFDRVCWLSLMLTFVFLMCRLLEERTSGIQELVKMVGVSIQTLGLSHFLNVLPVGLVFSIMATILLKVTSNPLIPSTNGFLIFLMLLLYFNSVVAMAFACSYIIKSSEYAATISVISYIALFTPASIITDYHLPYFVAALTEFLPHVPMIWFWKEVCNREVYGSGVTFSNMFVASRRDSMPVTVSFFMLIMQAVTFYALAWYFSLVRPGKYGQALPWNFFLKKQTRCKNEVAPDNDSAKVELINQDYFEHPPEDMKVGIRVEDVTKVYPKHKALKDVSLKAYQGEITVLVGHNGAGKTTLMSIITGMTSATKGKVFVNELDTVKQKAEVRKQIGLCPQHNMFFPNLTLQEHIMFFTMLKRGNHREAGESSVKLAAQLGLEEKLNEQCAALSGGMKRRAQLACALAGGADVLVLDEPTSGLDVETRRELWDLLLSLRGERTVLLSTHFMEEADALGDRVAALHSGELRCFATTMHLKKAIGNGYRLSLTTIGLPKESDITEEVLTHVPDATVKEKTINSLSFNLPATANNQFPQLFCALESKKPELSIDSIGVGVSTLEEVFLKLCSDVDTTVMENGMENAPPEPSKARLTGFPLYWRQLIVLLKRHLQFAIYRKWIFLTLQVVLPIAFICGYTHIMNNLYITEDYDRRLDMNFDMYCGRYRRVLYNVQLKDNDLIRNLKNKYNTVDFDEADDVAAAILRIGKRNILDYNMYLSGIELNETDAKVLFTTTVRHAAPVTLNMMSNLLAMHYLNTSDGQIHTYNHPIGGYVRHSEVVAEPKYLTSLVIWAIGVTFFIQSTMLHCVSLPCRERETGSRHIHIMSGCPPELHWTATLIFHMVLTTVFMIIPSVIAVIIFDRDNTINQADFLECFALVLIVGSLSMFALMYLISFKFSEKSCNIILVACLFLFGLICPSVKAAYDVLNMDKPPNGFVYCLLVLCSYIMPPYAMIVSMFKSVVIARMNTWCDLSAKQCPNIFINDFGWTKEDELKCCAGERPRCYFCMDESSPMSYVLILIAQFVVFMTMVFLTERGVFNGLVDFLKNFNYKPQLEPDNDQMVRAERTYVEKEITKPTNDIKKDSMLIDDIHKNYASLIGKSCNAVKGISFSVKKGECFGLLGVNGAGKSTTFKMLTAEECATRGKIFGNGYHLRAGTSKYLQTLGYCPQFFGLDMFQTGEQNLALVLTLQGLDAEHVKEEVQAWIEVVGLERYARRNVESYSGGCIRRLGTAAALCGGSALTLLDEPSAGVDVAARRRLWTALRKALKQRRSIVITSHSMDEMETLCSRIAIMCEGQIRALGTPPALRAAHAAGHAVVFKVKHATNIDEVDGAKSALNSLKGKLREKFNCNLKDEHKTMLHYHINETMRYSELFASLEALRNEFSNLIEDYAVTETTLEEVFLSFAKETKTGPVAV